jgi:predicted SprT family Zn-dependent metalloprotease
MLDELAMNPDSFTGCSDEEILSTLAHEMAHVWCLMLAEPSDEAA